MQDNYYEFEYEDEDENELKEDETEQEEYFFINDISDDKKNNYKCVFNGTESDFFKKVDDTDNPFKITNLKDLSYFTYESLDDLFDNLTMQRNPLALTQAIGVSNEDIDRCGYFSDVIEQAFGMGEYDDYLEANFYDNFDKFDGLKFTTEAEAKNAIIVAFLLSNEYYVITNPRSSYGDDEDYDEIIMYEELINDNLFQKYTDSSFENDKVKILKCENLKLLIEKYIDYDSPTIEFIYNIHKKNDNDNILIKEVLFNYFNDSNYIDKHLNDLLKRFEGRNKKYTLKNEIDLEKAMIECFDFKNELEVQFFKDNNIDLKNYMGDKFINLKEDLKSKYIENHLHRQLKEIKKTNINDDKLYFIKVDKKTNVPEFWHFGSKIDFLTCVDFKTNQNSKVSQFKNIGEIFNNFINVDLKQFKSINDLYNEYKDTNYKVILDAFNKSLREDNVYDFLHNDIQSILYKKSDLLVNNMKANFINTFRNKSTNFNDKREFEIAMVKSLQETNPFEAGLLIQSCGELNIRAKLNKNWTIVAEELRKEFAPNLLTKRKKPKSKW